MPDEPTDHSKPAPPKKTLRGKKQGLTLKQTKLLKALPTSDSVSEAGRKAGYSDAPTAHRALKSMSEKMVEVFERHGLTPDFVAQKCLSLMSAKEKKFFAFMGSVTEERDVDALDVQIKATDMVLRVHGAYKEAQNAGTTIRSETNTVCLVVTDERRAAELARLLAPHGSAGVVIDVAPQVHQDVG